MNLKLMGVAAILIWSATAQAAVAAAPFAWPKGARYAVSLTYDDAMASQLQNAWPALDKAGLRGTFFLSGAPYKGDKQLAVWKPVAKAGHELASHSIQHPCAKAKGLSPLEGSVEGYSLQRMEKELKETRSILMALGPPAGETFAYPCGDDYVGQAKVNYRPLVNRLFKAARNAWGGVADPSTVDLGAVPTVNGMADAASLKHDAELAMGQGGWAVYLFHGVGGEYLSVSLEAHQALLDYLKSSKDLVWVAPFGEVADWIKAQRAKEANH
jgi:peptidoglycan/xylan/chitin deacetylase (PgdA/CDA1 family)